MAISNDFIVKSGLVVKANTTVSAKDNLLTSNIVRTIAKPTLDLNFVRSSKLDPRISVTRSSSASYISSNGVMLVVGIDQPRFDYDIATKKPLGLLIEDTRTNMIANGNSLNSASPNTFTESTDIPRLNPSVRVLKSVRDTSTGDNNIGYLGSAPVLSTSSVSVASIWVYVPSATTITTITPTFEGQTYTTYTAFDTTKRDQWQRISITCTSNTTSSVTTCLRATGMVTGGYVYSTCWQVETGSWPTSYIHTTTAQATRQGDYVRLSGQPVSTAITPSAGTIYAEFDSITNGKAANGGNDFPFIYDFDNQSYQDQGYRCLVSAGYGPGVYTSIAAASNASYAHVTPLGTTSIIKLATAFQINDFATSLNGGAIQTSTIVMLPTAIDRITIGAQSYLGGQGNFHTGHIRRLTYWPQRITNAQIQQLTS